MFEIPDKIKKILKDYVDDLSKEIVVDSAILFGSYATGKQRSDSDIDLAVFSDNFADIDRIEATTFLFGKTHKYRVDLQPLAFDKNDLDNYQDNPFVNEIVTHGIKVA